MVIANAVFARLPLPWRDAAGAVGVDVAHHGVEDLQAERLLRAPRGLDLAARRVGEVHARRAHLVGDLRVGELHEGQQRAALAGRAWPSALAEPPRRTTYFSPPLATAGRCSRCRRRARASPRAWSCPRDRRARSRRGTGSRRTAASARREAGHRAILFAHGVAVQLGSRPCPRPLPAPALLASPPPSPPPPPPRASPAASPPPRSTSKSALLWTRADKTGKLTLTVARDKKLHKDAKKFRPEASKGAGQHRAARGRRVEARHDATTSASRARAPSSDRGTFRTAPKTSSPRRSASPGRATRTRCSSRARTWRPSAPSTGWRMTRRERVQRQPRRHDLLRHRLAVRPPGPAGADRLAEAREVPRRC